EGELDTASHCLWDIRSHDIGAASRVFDAPLLDSQRGATLHHEVVHLQRWNEVCATFGHEIGRALGHAGAMFNRAHTPQRTVDYALLRMRVRHHMSPGAARDIDDRLDFLECELAIVHEQVTRAAHSGGSHNLEHVRATLELFTRL